MFMCVCEREREREREKEKEKERLKESRLDFIWDNYSEALNDNNQRPIHMQQIRFPIIIDVV
jgi:hypothetical protein